MSVIPTAGAQWIPTSTGTSAGVLDWIKDNVVKPLLDRPPSPPDAPFIPTVRPTLPPPTSIPVTSALTTAAPDALCVWPWRISPATGRCELFVGPDIGPTPRMATNGIHAAMPHADHTPAVINRATRVCRRGHVLGIDGVCHPKKMIPNNMRMYPKPPRPLGTRAELAAVRKASSFGRRLASNKKRLRKLTSNLSKAC